MHACINRIAYFMTRCTKQLVPSIIQCHNDAACRENTLMQFQPDVLIVRTMVDLCTLQHTSPQWQGTVICLLLAAGWTWSGVMRHRELLRQRRMIQDTLHDATPPPVSHLACTARRRSHDNLAQLHDGALPGVTVVLPVRGCRATSAESWHTQLSMVYDGPLEFVFVVRDKNDPAHAALQHLLAERCASGIGRDRPTRILVAGNAQRCSQKIHKYVCS